MNIPNKKTVLKDFLKDNYDHFLKQDSLKLAKIRKQRNQNYEKIVQNSTFFDEESITKLEQYYFIPKNNRSSIIKKDLEILKIISDISDYKFKKIRLNLHHLDCDDDYEAINAKIDKMQSQVKSMRNRHRPSSVRKLTDLYTILKQKEQLNEFLKKVCN